MRGPPHGICKSRHEPRGVRGFLRVWDVKKKMGRREKPKRKNKCEMLFIPRYVPLFFLMLHIVGPLFPTMFRFSLILYVLIESYSEMPRKLNAMNITAAGAVDREFVYIFVFFLICFRPKRAHGGSGGV